MDINKLKQMITLSNEDFADAHEPVNDGIKEVPDADDIAAMVGRENVPTDMSSQGQGKAIPETTSDDEESEEGLTPETQPLEVDTEDESDPETSLAHDNVPAINAEEDVTANAKESLENFLPKIKRAELIGYAKRDVEALSQSIIRIRNRAGARGAVTVSAESINAAIVMADDHLARLARKRTYLEKRNKRIANENFNEIMAAPTTGVIPQGDLNQAPLAHAGVAPLPPGVGYAMTEQELAPLIDTEQEVVEMSNVASGIAQLETAGVAIEEITHLLRSNKGRVTKQTAAIIHASLEHIDITCGLRVRATGLESYDATPRSSLESVDVNEKSLSDRAGEIGAKIIKFLKHLYEIAERQWQKLTTGLTTLGHKAGKLEERINSLKGVPKDQAFKTPDDAMLYLDGEFVGTQVTKAEGQVLSDLNKSIKNVLNKGVNPIVAILNKGEAPESMFEELSSAITAAFSGNDIAVTLPGETKYQRNENGINIDKGTAAEVQGDEVAVPAIPQLKGDAAALNRYVKALSGDNTMEIYRKVSSTLVKGITDYRGKIKGKDFSEDGFQQVQSVLTKELINKASVERYLAVITVLARIASKRVAVLSAMADMYTTESVS